MILGTNIHLTEVETGGSIMKNCFLLFALLLNLFIAGCSSPENINSNELKKLEMKKTTDQTIEDDFIFRLVSEKAEYQEGEEVNLYGEILYIGKKDEVIIHHSASVISFSAREEIRGYDIDYAVSEIGASTTLKKLGYPYRSGYDKGSVIKSPFDDNTEDYEKFIEELLEGDGFPLGYYTVKGIADFSAETEGDAEKGAYKMEATIEFKVVD